MEIHHTCHIILGVKFSQLEFHIVQPLSNLERHAQTWPITVPILVKLGDPNPGTANAPAIPNGSGPKSSEIDRDERITMSCDPGWLGNDINPLSVFLEGCTHKNSHQALVSIHRSLAQLHLLRLTALSNTTTIKRNDYSMIVEN